MAKIKRYDDEFKKSLVDLHLAGKTHSDLCRDYGVSGSAHFYSIVPEIHKKTTSGV